jgi:hypothetical protein
MRNADKDELLKALSDIETIANELNEGNIPKSDYDDIIKNLEIARKLLNIEEPVRFNEFEGLQIKDYFCDGFFGSREFQMEDAIILGNFVNKTSDDKIQHIINARKTNGEIVTAIIDGQFDVRGLVRDWITEKEDE